MLRTAALLGAGVLTLVLVPLAAADDAVRFLAPPPGQVLVGETVFRLAVRAPADRVDLFCGGQLLGAAHPPDWTLRVQLALGQAGSGCLAAAYGGGRLLGKGRLPTQAAGASDAVEVTRVQLYPVITDAGGRHVPGLGRGDLLLYEDGREVPILAFASEANSLALSLLVDVSGSMGDRLALVQAAAGEFVEQLRPGETVGVHAFSDAVRAIGAPSDDHAAIVRAIDGLQAGGNTALYDALADVLQQASGRPGRQVVLLFSDGQDVRSVRSLADAVDAARRSDALVYTVATVHDEDAPEHLRNLERLAAATGGRSFPVREMRDLRGIFATIAEDLRSQYAVAFRPLPGPPGVRRIELRPRDPRLRVRSRTEYVHGGSAPDVAVLPDPAAPAPRVSPSRRAGSGTRD